MHGMAKLMCQRADAEDVVIPAHQNKRMRAGRACRKRAIGFAFAWHGIHPALVQAAAPHGAHVVCAKRLHAGAHPIHRLLIRYGWPAGTQWRPDVVRLQRVHAQCTLAHSPVLVPGWQVLAKN